MGKPVVCFMVFSFDWGIVRRVDESEAYPTHQKGQWEMRGPAQNMGGLTN